MVILGHDLYAKGRSLQDRDSVSSKVWALYKKGATPDYLALIDLFTTGQDVLLKVLMFLERHMFVTTRTHFRNED